MISKFSIAKALHDKLKSVSDGNGYTLVGNGVGYDPSPSDSFIQEFVIYGDDLSVGLSDSSSDIQFGVFQINVNTPKTQTNWSGLAVVDVISGEFAKGLELTHNSQMVRIKNASAEPMFQNETHLVHVISVTFSAIN